MTLRTRRPFRKRWAIFLGRCGLARRFLVTLREAMMVASWLEQRVVVSKQSGAVTTCAIVEATQGTRSVGRAVGESPSRSTAPCECGETFGW